MEKIFNNSLITCSLQTIFSICYFEFALCIPSHFKNVKM
jgi:hypothetical protein